MQHGVRLSKCFFYHFQVHVTSLQRNTTMSEPTVQLSDLLQLLVKFGELPENDFSAPILSIHPPADRARLAHLVQQRIRTLDVLCENAEKLTDKIAEIRRNLYRERAQCTTILAPISALPNELLIYIFIITSNVDRKSAPSIAHVCRRWRAIATDQPVLWRSIEVSSTLISNLTSFIKYSGEESLQLYINTGDEGEAEHSNNENVKLPEMATRDEFQRRLRSLEISGSNHLGILHPLAAAHGTLASLQSLTLCAGKTCDTMAYDLLFMELPQLDHLELHNVKVELGDLNGASVTELAFERHVSILTTHYIRNIFDRCPKLRRLTFSGMHDCFATERPHLLPSLEVLTIRNVWGNVAADFITHISAPHLKSLIIRPLEMNLQAERPGTLETLGRASDFERRDELEDARIFFEFQRLVGVLVLFIP